MWRARCRRALVRRVCRSARPACSRLNRSCADGQDGKNGKKSKLSKEERRLQKAATGLWKRAQKAAEKGELEDEGAHDMAVASFGREDYAAAATFFEAALGAGGGGAGADGPEAGPGGQDRGGSNTGAEDTPLNDKAAAKMAKAAEKERRKAEAEAAKIVKKTGKVGDGAGRTTMLLLLLSYAPDRRRCRLSCLFLWGQPDGAVHICDIRVLRQLPAQRFRQCPVL
jgi:hypothetical protein